MSLTVHDLPPTVANVAKARLCGEVRLDNDSRRRKQRRFVKLHQEAISGRYFIRDRLYGKRFIKAIRVLAIDGKLLNCGTAVLEREEEA